MARRNLVDERRRIGQLHGERAATPRILAMLLALCLCTGAAAGCSLQEQVEEPERPVVQETEEPEPVELPTSSNPYAVQNLVDTFSFTGKGLAEDGSMAIAAIGDEQEPALVALIRPDGTGTCIVGTWTLKEEDEAEAPGPSSATEQTDEPEPEADAAEEEPAFVPEVIAGTIDDPTGTPVELTLTSQEDGSWLLACEAVGSCRIVACDVSAALLDLVRSGVYSNDRAAEVARAASEREEQERQDAIARAEAETQLEADEGDQT